MTLPDIGFATGAVVAAGYILKMNSRQKTHSKILCAICKKLNIDLKLANIKCDDVRDSK